MTKKISSENDSSSKEGSVSFTSLFRFSERKDIIIIVCGVLCAIANGTMLPLMTIVFGDMVSEFYIYEQSSKNQVAKDAFNSTVLRIILWLVVLGVITFVLSYLLMTFFMWSGERQLKKIRTKYFSALLHKDMDWYDQHYVTNTSDDQDHSPTSFSNRVSNDTLLIQDGISEKAGLVIQYSVTFITGFVIAFIRCWQLALVLSCAFPLLAISGAIMSKLVAKASEKGQMGYAAAGSHAQEILSSIRTVFAFNAEQRELKRYQERITKGQKENEKIAFMSGIGLGTIMLLMFCTYGLGFWYGSVLIENGTIPQDKRGLVTNVFFAIIIGAFSIGNASPHLVAMNVARGAAKKIFDVIDDQKERKDHNPHSDMFQSFESLDINNIFFSYPSRSDLILKGCSIKIKRGSTVAFVGKSGCGKSTLFRLLLKLYEPDSGSIVLCNSKELHFKDFSANWIRSNIGLVGQEPVLFDLSIAKNIAIGDPSYYDGMELRMDRIIQACKLANAHDFIQSLPEGYNTIVGEGGSSLSGGQKQRIAIARALIKNPPILLLDEATSALDTESERLVQEALVKAQQGRTTLVIAHRLSTIQHADMIYVMGDGKVIEQGKHYELLKNNGIYRELVNSQMIASKNDSLDAVINEYSTSDVKLVSEHIETPKVEYNIPTGRLMKRILEYNRPEWKLMFGGCLVALVNGAIMPCFSFVFAEINTLFSENDISKLRSGSNLCAGLFAILGVVCFLCQILQLGLFGVSGERLTARLRILTFSVILSQSISWLDDPLHSPGILHSKLASDADEVKGMMGQLFGSVIQTVVTLMAGLLIALITGWKLTLVILCTIPLMIACGALQARVLGGYGHKTKKAYEHSGKIASESIQNIRTIVSIGREDYFERYFNDSLQGPYKIGLKKAITSGIGFGFSQAMMFFAYGLAYYYGSILILNEEYSLDQMNRVIFVMIFSAFSAGQISSFAPSYAKAKVAASSVLELLDSMNSVDIIIDNKKNVKNDDTSIQFDHVTFSYPSRRAKSVLQSVSLTIPSGRTVALVGHSGSGKSSVIGLIERFYDPDHGQVLISGKNIRDIDIRDIRDRIGWVGQEPVLFCRSIAENIAFGKPDITKEEMEDAARQANIHDFIQSLPEGYNTIVGEKATLISVGQKQRIAIARAMVRKPLFLLLDEATSALDTESERLVQEALVKAQQGRTTLVIAHRLSTIQHADMIYVMGDGKVIEQGNHTSLLQLGGMYASMVSKQSL